MADLVIVDDDPDSLDILAEIMVSAGHEVRVAYNGEDGLVLVRERHPDLAILDVEMPLLGGPGMANRMFIENMGLDQIPLILLSGVVDLREAANQVGTPYFLAKPYRFEQIMKLVEEALLDRTPPRPRTSVREASP